MQSHDELWCSAVLESLRGYKKMIDAAIAQLSDNELHQRLTPTSNSVGVLLRHLGGNLKSRWTDFLTTDGEKPNRGRDSEFEDWTGDRASLVAFFDEGWQAFVSTIESLGPADIEATIKIRGESHTVPDSIVRAITDLSYHVGQLVMIARLVHTAVSKDNEWRWLTIPPGQSSQFNAKTWGTSASHRDAGKK